MERVIRYEVLGIIGEGSSGIVQEARSLSTGARVALKRLRPDGPHDTAHLKREFRALADVVHPNLVRLHQLFDDQGEVVLAMDLVDGSTFLDWVWGRPRGGAIASGAVTWGSGGSGNAEGEVPTQEAPQLTEAVLQRLRGGLRGLAAGLSALHAQGLLHRDIKPGNVMVDVQGRVQVVDFGLAMRPGYVDNISGTAAYMSPEQIAGGALTEASDWYGVGSLIFEALTGRTPFVGPVAGILFDKQVQPAPDVLELAPDAPHDLVDLCARLLHTTPEGRPHGPEICAALGSQVSAPPREVPFVGRRRELAELTTALHHEGLRLVHVAAPSGLGKSRLVEHFLGEACRRHLVLSGRCYEREHTMFKALDPVAEALASWLVERGPLRTGLDDWGPVARLFPALARAAPARVGLPRHEPVAERLLATHQLARLLAAVADEQPVVLWVDDLQWADRDSLLLLRDLLGDEALPPVLCILSWRPDHEGMEETLAPLSDVPATRVDLPRLEPGEALELLRAHGAGEARAARLAMEGEGSPFFLRQLASHHGPERDLHAVLSRRVDELGQGSRDLLQAVAVAARPLEPEVAMRAARHAGAGDMVSLTVARLLTTRRGHALECTHDRIRDAVVASLSAQALRDQHRALAEAMGPQGDPELLCEHWEAAGEALRAGPLAIEAAQRAEQAFAFEKAVALYRRARSLGVSFDADLRVAFGRALGRAGYAEGADELLSVVDEVGATRRERIEREALHQLLRAGRLEHARPLLPEVVRRVGLPWPRSRVGTYAEILWTSARLRLGLVRPSKATARDEQALQLALELSMSLSYVDMVRTAMLTGRAIELAERLGAPPTRALAAAMRASNASLLGDFATGGRELERSDELLPADVDPVQRASTKLHHGIAACARADFAVARDTLAEVASVFDARGLPYEAGMAQTFRSFALVQLGAFAEARALRDRMIRQARQRGDKHLEVFFRVSYSVPPGLMRDRPDEARSQLSEATGRWAEGVSTLWLYAQVFEAKVEIYEGDHETARSRLAATARAAAGGALLSVPLNSVGLWSTWAAAAAPGAATDPGARRELRQAIRRLRSLASPYGPVLADVWEASLGGAEAAARSARSAEQLRAMGTPWLETMVRCQAAQLRGAPVASHHERLRGWGFVDPARMCQLFAFAP